MRFYLLLLILKIIFLTIHCKKSNTETVLLENKKTNTSTEDGTSTQVTSGDRWKVKASSLYLRKEPDLNSEKLALLPSGTSFSATKTDKSTTYKDQTEHWYYSKELNGYIFGSYIVPVNTKIKKVSMDLHTVSSIPCSTSDPAGNKKKLELFNDSLIYREFYPPNFKKSTVKKGIYSFHADGVLKLQIDSENITLKYMSSINGYVPEDKFTEVKNYKVDKENCVFIKNNCSKATVIPYYCPKPKN